MGEHLQDLRFGLGKSSLVEAVYGVLPPGVASLSVTAMT